ncbi:phospholipid carrier-dependent glycosyltransferase [Methyloterricola oryzae]|uniref:phospholipid carrier-dependent glycosyltransferase n=1 Tax=Methyloterricola oryzae TaxID=1495050 RepID=UPI0005EBE99C|nr:phospholipid carrier-dependent glycosyltransferase [Methyloterricola oryzae]
MSNTDSSMLTPDAQVSFWQNLRRERLYMLLFAGILTFCFLTKVARLGFPTDFYFDEVYHGFTATVYLHGDKQAYDPWAKPPQGKAFEWTHPPLAKLIMTGMMVVFGENSFGWRIGSVLFGTAATVATALLAFELFGSMTVALTAMALMSLEGLVLTQSRVAMNDAYFICFTLLAFIFYVRWRKDESRVPPLYLCGLGLGLAVATKWTAFYLFVILALDLAARAIWTRRLPESRVLLHLPLALALLPVALYMASYIHFFAMGWEWKNFVELQKQMWWYHTGLKAGHSFQSVPWQWILNLRPVWLYVDYSKEGYAANIYNLGNSVILYTGLWAVFSTMVQMRDRLATWPVWFALLSYFMLWLPWTFSPRMMLFYHYLPAVPLLCILLARWLEDKRTSPLAGEQVLAPMVLGMAFVWFVVFYPDNTAIAVPQAFADLVYFAVPGWKF